MLEFRKGDEVMPLPRPSNLTVFRSVSGPVSHRVANVLLNAKKQWPWRMAGEVQLPGG